MKAFIKRSACLLLCLCMALALCACGKKQLDGVYEPVDGYGTLTFEGDTITVSAYGYSESATYEIKGDKIYVTTYNEYNGEPKDTEVVSFSQKGDTIVIDGDTYVREGSSVSTDSSGTSDSSGKKSSSGLSVSKLRGVYHQLNGSFLLAMGESMMVQKTDYGIFKGPYHLEGDTLVFDYTLGLEEVEAGFDRITYNVKLDGDRLTLDIGNEELVYIRDAGSSAAGFDFGPVLKIAGIAVGALVLLLLVLFVIRRLRRARRARPAASRRSKGGGSRTAAAAAAAGNVSRRAAEGARGISSALAAGVSAGVSAGKSALRDQKKIPVSPDACCICGGSLEEGAVPLAGLRSGREAWIDRRCLNKLQAMAQGDSYEDFQSAAQYMRSQSRYLEPEVAEALGRFVKKCSARFIDVQNETFEL